MKTNRKTATCVAALFLITTATYLIGNGLVESFISTSDFLAVHTLRVSFGAVLMFINCIGIVGIGVLMFPVLKQYNEITALSYLGARMLESILLMVGVISLLLLIPLSQEYVASTNNSGYFQTLSTLAIKGNFFAYQLGMMVLGIGSLLFCYALYHSRLIPRFLSAWGFIGYTALFMGAVLELFGFKVGLFYSIPGGLFELALPLWLFVKGFSSPISTSVPIKTLVNKI